MYLKAITRQNLFRVGAAITVLLIALSYSIDFRYYIRNFYPHISPPSFVNGTNSTNCLSWSYPNKVQAIENPRIRLDSNRFLFPGLIYWGLNNQVIGLRESTFLAISLNRTLVIPKFHGHYLNPGTLSPHQVIDVERLCKFVSCISIEELNKQCGDSFDVVFQIKRYFIVRFEADTGMRILNPTRIYNNISFPSHLKLPDSKQSSKIPVLPNLNSTKQLGKKFPLDSSSLRTEYDTKARCAIAAAVFNCIEIPAKANIALPLKADKNHFDATNNEVMSAVIDAIRHPPCIVKAAKDYIRDILKDQKYVALHWRFDREDWIRITCRKENLAKPHLKKACTKINNATAAHVANSLVEAIEKEFNISQNTKTHTPVPIYIAAPPTLHQFRDEIYGNISKISKIFVKPTESIITYLTKQYKGCWKENGWINLKEMFSLCEMELITYSDWFFFSVSSTWSNNIRSFRLTVDKNGSVSKRNEKSIVDIL